MESNVFVVSNQITVFAGYMPDVGLHSHHTAVLVFSLDGEPIGVGGGASEWVDSRQYFLHPDTLNKMRNYDHPIGCVFFEPEGSLYPLFIARRGLGSEGFIEYPESLASVIALFEQFAQARLQTDQFIQDIVGALLGEPEIPSITPWDARVMNVSRLIKRDLAENTSALELAHQVDISERRLSGLFKRQVGVPIRKYRLWLRLKAVAQLANEGMNLTDAALEAGFSDSAHFSNTCRKMLGVKPTDLLLNNIPLRLFASSDCV